MRASTSKLDVLRDDTIALRSPNGGRCELWPVAANTSTISDGTRRHTRLAVFLGLCLDSRIGSAACAELAWSTPDMGDYRALE